MKKYDCAVLGAGASGMMASVMAAKRGLSVCIIEKSDEPGKKLLRTGNGKCNITHDPVRPCDYPAECRDFVAEVFEKFSGEDTVRFFESIGIFICDKNGYIYPMSQTALSVRNALRDACRGFGVDMITANTVKKIHEGFVIETDGKSIESDSVIVALGSGASLKNGSDEGIRLINELGVKTSKRLPALVKLISDDRTLKKAVGVRHIGKVALRAEGEVVAQDAGEIQFVNDGISGIPVFQVSREAVSLLDNKKEVFAELDLVPDLTSEELHAYIESGMNEMPHRTIQNFFSGIIPSKLVAAASDKAGISCERKLSDVDISKMFKIAEVMKNYTLVLTGSAGLEEAQVCRGGVLLDEIDPQTMQHKKINGLYFAGEIVDVDGPCGGYNLQWAWSSGAVAGMSV